MPTNPSFWYVTSFGEKFRRVVQENRDKRDLQEELSGKRISAGWIAPGYKIVGTGTWPDWMAFWVPLLSRKARSCLQELIAPHCEFLPWIEESGHEYTLVNVTTRVPRSNWSCERSSIYFDEYAAADIISVHGTTIPEIFKLEGYQGKVFVSDAVAQLSVERGLRGAMFVDPKIPAMHLPFISPRFGRKGTGFVRIEDAPVPLES